MERNKVEEKIVTQIRHEREENRQNKQSFNSKYKAEKMYSIAK